MITGSLYRASECMSVVCYVKHRIFDEMEAIGGDGSVLSIEDTLNVSLNVEISTSHDQEEESRSMFNIILFMRYRGFRTISGIPVTVRTLMSFYYQIQCERGGGGHKIIL